MNATNNNLNNTPDYNREYWMSDKANNLILKKIIDYLTNYGDGGGEVKPMLDGQKHVRLMVQRGNHQEEIVFGEGFPNKAPMIEVTGGAEVNKATEWHFNGDIYDSFVRYYDECFKKEKVVRQLVNSETGAPKDSNPYEFIESVALNIEDLEGIKNSSQPVFDGYAGEPFACSSLVFDSNTDGFVEAPIGKKEVVLEGPVSLAKEVSVYGPYGKKIVTKGSVLGIEKYNVKFYKGEGETYQPHTFVVEDIQSGCPKAFYVDADGSKKELKVEIEELVTDMTVFGD